MDSAHNILQASSPESESTLREILWQALKAYSTESLLNLVCDEDPIVRACAAKQLHFRPEDKVFKFAERLCFSTIAFEREIAAFILGQLGTPIFPYREASLNLLIDLASDEIDEVVVAALVAIGHLNDANFFGNETVLHLLLSQANNINPDIRSACAFSLSSFGAKKEAVEVLNNLVLDNDEDVAEWASVSLEIIQEQEKQSD